MFNGTKLILSPSFFFKSLTQDSYTLRASNGVPVEMSNNGIAWQSDVDVKFHNPPNGTPGVRVISDFQDPDFIVWMRTAGLPTFRKLHRVINTRLVGTYTIEIQNSATFRRFLFVLN